MKYVTRPSSDLIDRLQKYDQMKSELELLRILAEAEHDVHNGRVAPMQKSLDELRAFLIATKPK
jgi:hypothetical protein